MCSSDLIAAAALPEPRADIRAEVLRLHAAGLPDSGIAAQLGARRHTVSEIRRRAGLQSNATVARTAPTCPRGHERTEQNTYTDPRGRRRCRKCNTGHLNTNQEKSNA